MSLNFNNTQIENITFNKTDLDKVYMNNVLVFEKSKPIYKRRIMAGDNLKGKYVYGEFPKNFYNNIPSVSLDQNSNDRPFVTYTNGNVTEYGSYGICDMHYTNFIAQVVCHDCIGDGRDDYVHQLLYDWAVDTREINDYVLIDNSKDHIVTKILNCPSYRYCHIENENIRPIQIGDKLTNGTKLYFNFPDNIINNIPWDIDNIFTTTNNNYYLSHKSLEFKGKFNNNVTTMYSNTDLLDTATVNISNIVCQNNLDTVNYITPEKLKHYIMVDTTTLG